MYFVIADVSVTVVHWWVGGVGQGSFGEHFRVGRRTVGPLCPRIGVDRWACVLWMWYLRC